MRRSLVLLLLASLALPALAVPPILEERSVFRPELGRKGMVCTAHPLATEAGAEALRAGGNAVDAAVTAYFALAVTLPRAGNLGGGGFLLVRTPEGKVESLDFRESAPAAAHRDMYLGPDGRPDSRRSTLGALAVGVPGSVAGMAALLERHGTLSLAQALEPARRLATDGFPATRGLHDGAARTADELALFPESARIFLPGGRPPEVGERFVQRDLAWSLGEIAAHGPEGFYRGEIARRIVAGMERHGGLVTAEDLASYRAVWREPVRGSYRGCDIWSMAPPSSGGVHLVQMLNVLEGFDMAALGQGSGAQIHLLAETMRTAYADRSKWLGDPDYGEVPVEWLTSRGYAERIRAAIPRERARSSSEVAPGSPPAPESPDTTHLSAVDASGLAVSITTSLNFSYGSRLVAEGTGILLNNTMDDFSAAPGVPNAYGLLGGELNAIEPGKRPLSSMTPTLVTRDGELLMTAGSPGGSRIITAVLQAILNVVDYGRNAQAAVSMPRVHHQWQPDELLLEEGISPDTVERLRERGHRTETADAMGHVVVILRRPDGLLEGGVDPRREGEAAGVW